MCSIQFICDQFRFNKGICIQFVFNLRSIHGPSLWIRQFVFNLCSICVPSKLNQPAHVQFVLNLGSIAEFVSYLCSVSCSAWVQSGNLCTICVQFEFNSCSLRVRSNNFCSVCVQSVFNLSSIWELVFNLCSICVQLRTSAQSLSNLCSIVFNLSSGQEFVVKLCSIGVRSGLSHRICV